MLIPKTGTHIRLPWGAVHEEERARRIAEGFDNVDILPRTSLGEIARVLAGAKFVVSVDTDPSHLAAVLNRPNVTLYGSTDPRFIGGYGKSQLAYIAPEGKPSLLAAQQVLIRLSSDV